MTDAEIDGLSGFTFVYPEDVRIAAGERVRRFIRDQVGGAQCRVLSRGDKCECLLCDMDRIESVVRVQPAPESEVR